MIHQGQEAVGAHREGAQHRQGGLEISWPSRHKDGHYSDQEKPCRLDNDARSRGQKRGANSSLREALVDSFEPSNLGVLRLVDNDVPD